MLDSTGDTDCKVYVRTNSLTCLTYLKILRFPASIYNCTRAAYGTADSLCQIIQNLEVLRASYATAAGYKDLSIHDINGVGYSLNNFQNINIFVVLCESRIELSNNSFFASFLRSLLHNTRTNGCHLRTEIRASDGSDGVAAECRTSHKQLIVLCLSTRNRIHREIADIKFCTVCSQTCMDSSANTRTKVTTDCSCTDQEDFRFELFDNRCDCMCVRLCTVLF